MSCRPIWRVDHPVQVSGVLVAVERNRLGETLADVQLGLRATVWHGAWPESAGNAALVRVGHVAKAPLGDVEQLGHLLARGAAFGGCAVVVKRFLHGATIGAEKRIGRSFMPRFPHDNISQMA